jgi:hypothetical protein
MGMGMGMAKGMGMSQERNMGMGTGNRVADGTVKNTPSSGTEVKGDDKFINLPPRQREMIRQALNGQFPPEYDAIIRQYNLNLNKKPMGGPGGR